MTHVFDEFSTALASSVPRRETLRRIGLALAATLAGPAGASAALRLRIVDPCKTHCKCRNSKQQSQCLAACKACNGDRTRLAGSCGAVVCCGSGLVACGSYCANVQSDLSNCGACGYTCDPPGPHEVAACVSGRCEYDCVPGAVDCNGACTMTAWDPNHCGACGNVCGGATPYCNNGQCSACPPGLTSCGGMCVDLANDANNCGGCGVVCSGPAPYCSAGVCTDCAGTVCNGECVDLWWDSRNCGACGNECPSQFACAWGVCEGMCVDC